MKVDILENSIWIEFEFNNELTVAIDKVKKTGNNTISVYHIGSDDAHNEYHTAAVCAAAGINSDRLETNVVKDLSDTEIAQVLKIAQSAMWYRKYHFQRR